MIGLSDILTAIKNLVQAVSNLAIQRQTSPTTPASAGATLLTTGNGTLLNVSVTVAGTSAGTVYDAVTVQSITPAKALVSVPNTLGIIVVGIAFTQGLVYVPGTGQSANLTFSPGQ